MLLKTLGCRRTIKVLDCYFALLKWRVHLVSVAHRYRRALCDCHPPKTTAEIWTDPAKWQQFTAAGKSLFSGLYIGWPLFRAFMGDTEGNRLFPVQETLSKFGGPLEWGGALVFCAFLIFMGLRCGSTSLQKLAVHCNLVAWGALLGLLVGTVTPGMAIPLGLWVMIDEFRRLRRTGKERRAIV